MSDTQDTDPAPPAPAPAPVVPTPVSAPPVDPTDRTHPDHDWLGGSHVATADDVAAAIAHVKAWIKKEFGRV